MQPEDLIFAYQVAGRCLLQLRRQVPGEWMLLAAEGSKVTDLAFRWVRREPDRRYSFNYTISLDSLLPAVDPVDCLLQAVLSAMGDTHSRPSNDSKD